MYNVIPLSKAASGRYRVISLQGGRGFIHKIAEMGIYPDSTLEVLGAMDGSGPVRVQVKGSHLAIGRGMAARILVERES